MAIALLLALQLLDWKQHFLSGVIRIAFFCVSCVGKIEYGE